MRIRRKPWARPELAAAEFFIDQPKENRGNWKDSFLNSSLPLHIELGCGKGGFIAQKAAKTPNINFIAIDIKSDVLGLAKRQAESYFAKEQRSVDNLKIAAYNIEWIREIFAPEDKIERIYINFCNPWPKKKDNKHRLTHPKQLMKYRELLVPNGEIVFKTDDKELYRDTVKYFSECGFEILEKTENLSLEHPASEFRTEHEDQFREIGLTIHYIVAKMRENGMKRPLILVTAGYKTAKTGLSQRYQYQNYADAILLAGGMPIMTMDAGVCAQQLAQLCDGMLLTGGPDIDPALFKEEIMAECGEIDHLRDRDEYAYIKEFLTLKKPILGICRGMQVLNAYLGGTLYQDLPSQCGTVHGDSQEPHKVVHKTTLLKNSILNRLYGDEILTNSYHHQAVKDVAEGFEVVAVAEDKTIEAISHKELPLFAVQWHPERMTGVDRFVEHGPDSDLIFKTFVDKCRK